MKDLKIIYYRENLWQSVLADTYTFAIMLGSFGVNSLYIKSKVVSGLLLVMFVFFLLFKDNVRKHTFYSKEEAIEYINNEQ